MHFLNLFSSTCPMKAWDVLRESLVFLLEEPLFFVPILISTTLWSALFVSLLLLPLEQSVTIYLWAGLPLIAVSTLLKMMYPTLVRDYHEGSFDFRKALEISFYRLPRTLAVFLIPTLIGGALLVLPLMVFVTGYAIGNIVLMTAAGILGLVMMAGLMALFYFAPTSVILDDTDVMEAVGESFFLSTEYDTEVVLLVVVSLIIFGISALLTGAARGAGLTLFVIFRYLGALVSAYIWIVNPEMYLELS